MPNRPVKKLGQALTLSAALILPTAVAFNALSAGAATTSPCRSNPPKFITVTTTATAYLNTSISIVSTVFLTNFVSTTETTTQPPVTETVLLTTATTETQPAVTTTVTGSLVYSNLSSLNGGCSHLKGDVVVVAFFPGRRRGNPQSLSFNTLGKPRPVHL
ncbi:MAG: hypothetical protein HY247_01385 [archaeon]|nr:MAG: hypothetical protein HY247_01385 [archaeon]